MTDIVERLRKDWRHLSIPSTGDLCNEAADEIERLRERLGPRGLEVVEIGDAGHYVNVKVKAEIKRLRAVITRAKDALLDGQSTQWVHDLLAGALHD